MPGEEGSGALLPIVVSGAICSVSPPARSQVWCAAAAWCTERGSTLGQPRDAECSTISFRSLEPNLALAGGGGQGWGPLRVGQASQGRKAQRPGTRAKGSACLGRGLGPAPLAGMS